MAQTFTNTGVQKGNFDGLIDFLLRVADTKTPFLTMCGRTQAIATLHKWVSEDLLDAEDNSQTEGFTPSFAAADVRRRVQESNECELIAREFSFSDTQEAVKKAGGITSDYDHEKMKKFKEIALDLDRSLLIQTAQARDADAGTAGRITGLVSALTTTRDISGTIISTDVYDDFVQTIVDEGADPDTVICAGFNRRAISGWAAPQRTYNDDQTKMTNTVLVYYGSWGTQKIVYDKHITASRIAIVHMSHMKVAYLRPPFHNELGRTTDGRRGYCGLEATLQFGSTRSGGIITNTATAG